MIEMVEEAVGVEDGALAFDCFALVPADRFRLSIDAAKDPRERVNLRVARVGECRRLGDVGWIEMAEQVHALACEVVMVVQGSMFAWQLYAQDPSWTWGQFVEDTLELAAPFASQLKNIWETWYVYQGLSRERLAQIGFSKLALALGYARRLARTGQADAELVEMLDCDDPASYVEVERHIAQRRMESTVVDDEDGRRVMSLNVAVTEPRAVGDALQSDVVVYRDNIPCRIGTISFDGGERWPWEDVALDDVRDVIMGRVKGVMEIV